MAELSAEIARLENHFNRRLREVEKRARLHEQAILDLAAALREAGFQLEVVGSLPSTSIPEPPSQSADPHGTIPA
jgi:hypothetical protein